MANTSKKFKEGDDKTFNEKVSGFVVKYRLVVIGIIIGLFVIALGFGVWYSVSENMQGKAFNELEGLSVSLNTARNTYTGDELTAEETKIAASAEALAAKNKHNGAGVRADMLAAEIYFAQKSWEDARAAWLRAASAKPKAYTAPLAYYNAAVCSEELGDVDSAVMYYGNAASSSDFSLQARALFNLGRVEDQRGNYAQAAVQYESLVAKYPSDAWALMAKSRLLALQIEGKIN